jgi:hypothetical protein
MASAIPNSSIEMPPGDPVFARLEDQIAWYDRKSLYNQHTYKRLKMIEIAAAAMIPFIAVSKLPHSAITTGLLGVIVTIIEGAVQLNQYQQNYVSYRSTCEALKHEKFTFLVQAGSYAGVANPRALLAERVESLVSQEHSKWASNQKPEIAPKQD